MSTRGQILARGKDKWMVRVYTGKSAKGTNKYSAKIVRGKFSQADRVRTQMLRELDTQTFVPNVKTTLAGYLEEWLEGRVNITPKTRAGYQGQLNKILPVLGHVRLTDLTRTHVQRLVTSLTAEGLSPRSVEFAVTVLRAGLEHAIQAGVLLQNPARKVELPSKTRRPPSVLSMEQVAALLESTIDHPMHCLWRVLLTSGMRPQEVLALKWADLSLEDPQNGWVAIQRAVVDDARGGSRLSQDVKADSRRRIGLPSSTIDALRAHRSAQRVAMLELGPGYTRQDLVFPNSVGKILDHNKVRRQWKAALRAAGLPQVRLYDTRHSHATALLAGGADITWVSARLGHKDIQMTRDHYAHVLQESHREMGDMTERLLQAAHAN